MMKRKEHQRRSYSRLTAPIVMVQIGVALALLLAMPFLLRCASTPAGRTYQTIGSLKIAVDTGMQIWADRVIDGKTTPAQESQVRKAFNEYTASARAAAAVMRSTGDTAPPDLAAAANALLILLQSFGVNTGGQ